MREFATLFCWHNHHHATVMLPSQPKKFSCIQNLECDVIKLMYNLRYMKSVFSSEGFHSSFSLPQAFLLLVPLIICPFVWGCTTETYFLRHLHENWISAAFRELAFSLFSPLCYHILSSDILFKLSPNGEGAVSNREKCRNWKHKIGPIIRGYFPTQYLTPFTFGFN